MSDCNHKVKRAFRHGRNAKPNLFCKRCKKPLSRNELKKGRRSFSKPVDRNNRRRR